MKQHSITYQSTKPGFSAFSIIVVFLLLSIVGAGLLPFLNISLVPSRSLPSITIRYAWHNTSARVIESEATTKLEGMLNGITGVQNIESKSSRGNGRIKLSFKKGVNMDVARFEVSSVIRRAYPELPEGMTYPGISVNSPGNQKKTLLSYSLYGAAAPHFLQKYAENHIKPEIGIIQGIEEIEVYGSTPFKWHIDYDPQLMKSLDIVPGDIQSAVQNWFNKKNIGYGTIKNEKGPDEFIAVEVATLTDNPELWSNIPVKKSGSRLVYLTDIASVSYMEQEYNSFFRINGLNTINIVIYPEDNVNNLKLAKKVKQSLHDLDTELPAGFTLINMYDATEFIVKELQKVFIRALIAVIALLLFVFFISRKVRYLMLITVSLLANLLIAAILYRLLNLQIHIYSLAGITISLGIIIDNSIIMADHLRHQGKKNVFIAILAATLTTIGCLSLVFFLPENQRINLYDFSLVIIVNLSVSLFIALFFIPSLLEKNPIIPSSGRTFLKRKKIGLRCSKKYSGFLLFCVRYKTLFIVLLILAFGTPLYLLPNKVESNAFWGRTYNKTMGSEWYNNRVRQVLDKISGGTLRLFTEFVYEKSFYREPGQTKLYVRGKMPEGSTIDQINQAVKKMEGYIAGFDEIQLFKTRITSHENASIEILFYPPHDRGTFPYYLKGHLIARANNLGGMDWSIYGVGRGFSNAISTGGKDSYIYLYGYNYDELYAHAESLSKELQKNSRVRDLEILGERSWMAPNRHEYVMEFDQNYLALSHFSTSEVYRNLYYHTGASLPLASFFIHEKRQQVTLSPRKSSHYDFWDLKEQFIEKNDSLQIKLKLAGKVSKQKTGNDIFKENQQYRLVAGFNFLGPPLLKDRFIKTHIEAVNKILPLGYTAAEPSWSWRRQNDENKGWLLALVLVIIFFICSILFESLAQPLAILSIIPVSFIGVFLTFYAFNINFDQGGFACFILLAGITVNAGLYIINDYNNLLNNCSISRYRAYLKAFNQKIIPVSLTIVSTIIGLIPFLIGGQNEVFWFAFAAGSIGGLVFSVIGILIFLPVFFIRKSHIKAS